MRRHRGAWGDVGGAEEHATRWAPREDVGELCGRERSVRDWHREARMEAGERAAFGAERGELGDLLI